MQRPISRVLFKAYYSQDFHPIDLVDIKLVGQNAGDAFHFTNAGQTVVWNGITYNPISLKLGAIEERATSEQGTVPGVKVLISNVDRQIAQLLSSVELDGAKVTVYRTDRRIITTRGPMLLTIGEARKVMLTGSMLSFELVTILGQLERIAIPRRTFQAHCNWIFGEGSCSVNLNGNDAAGIPITITTAAQAGSTLQYLVLPASVLATAGSPANPSQFFDQAKVWVTDGLAGLQAKAFQRYELVGGQNRFWLRAPLLAVPAPGDPVKIRRSCLKVLSGNNSCTTYLGVNAVDHFGGFRDVPPVRFKPTITDHAPTGEG